MLVYKKNKSTIHLHAIPVMKCGCVFCEFSERKLATRKDKIKIIKSLPLVLSVVRRDARSLLAFTSWWRCIDILCKSECSLWRPIGLLVQLRIARGFGKLVIIFILSYLFVLPTSFLQIPKTRNRTSLQVWHANVLHFCSFCKPTFSGAAREWDALYNVS
jgi:hypothetical protein